MSIYQLDFLTPGIIPWEANSLKQMRQTLKSRRYPRRRPQRKQRRTNLDRYFGCFSARAITDFFAIVIYSFLRGKPCARYKAIACSRERVLGTSVISTP